jgi:hypothetical protein
MDLMAVVPYVQRTCKLHSFGGGVSANDSGHLFVVRLFEHQSKTRSVCI